MRGRTAFLAILVTLLCVMFARLDADKSKSVITLHDGMRVSGMLAAEQILIPRDSTVIVEDGVELVASLITIEGTLVGVDRGIAGQIDGPAISLVATAGIEITGRVLGGRGGGNPPGADSWGATGGTGSSITIESPATFVDGVVIAGAGGVGGLGAKSGAGGGVTFYGSFYTHRPAGTPNATGGTGAPGALPHPITGKASEGGDGGNVFCYDDSASPVYAKVTSEARRSADRQVHRQGGVQLASLMLFRQGPGPQPSGQGAPGTAGSPNPGNGVNMTAGDAGTPGTSESAAGHGASGPTGGTGTGGDGGEGGTGGTKHGNGGASGEKGTATAGEPGAGGTGGSGMSSGSAGAAGAAGTASPGVKLGAGARGADCPEE